MTGRTSTEASTLHGPGLTDVRMMIVAHSSFRRELGLSPRAVRAVADGDLRRARVVAEHVELFLSLLHHHHLIEDDLLWEKLLDRVPGELAPLVHLMERQHEVVADLLEQAGVLLGVWRRTAAARDANALADLLSTLVTALLEHLDAEEADLLPIMARNITADEWREFTERGMESIPKKMVFLGFGMMLYEGDPQVIALEMRKVPAPIRLLLPPLARWSFRRYARTIHGVPAPQFTPHGRS